MCSDRGLPLHIYASRRCVIQFDVAEVADVTDRQTPSFDTAGSGAVTLGALERLQLIQLHVTPTNVLNIGLVVKPSNGLEIQPHVSPGPLKNLKMCRVGIKPCPTNPIQGHLAQRRVGLYGIPAAILTSLPVMSSGPAASGPKRSWTSI